MAQNQKHTLLDGVKFWHIIETFPGGMVKVCVEFVGESGVSETSLWVVYNDGMSTEVQDMDEAREKF